MYKMNRIIELATLNMLLIMILIVLVLSQTIFDDIYSNCDLSTSSNIIETKKR